MRTWLQGLGSWLDDRTGWRQLTNDALYETIPGGSRWIYVTGSMLVFAFVTQLITGIFLWMYYSPSGQNAWESVYWIQNHLQGGWFLRGVHHYMAHAMVVLLPLHMIQVIVCKAYIAPREVNYWLGLLLMLLVLALGLTGYLLPWDQKGYWATKVATNLMSLPPGGNYLQKLVVGGREYGHYTLTRFFALHAGILPALLILVLVLHVALFRKHGITAVAARGRPDATFWPDQVLKDAIACLGLLIVVMTLVYGNHGAELGPPAEPTEEYGAARPDWYFLFLFQLLKIAPTEFIGAIVIPCVVMGLLFVMPFFGKVNFGHIVNVVVLFVLFLGAAYLTYEAYRHDTYANKDLPEPTNRNALTLHLERVEASEQFLAAKQLAHDEYQRITQLIGHYGIPRVGAAAGLVHNDPEIQGPRIFTRKCANCHSYLDPNGEGIPGPKPPRDEHGIPVANPSPYGAPNLYGIGTREWLQKLLQPESFVSDEVFGLTKHKDGEMANFVIGELSDLDDKQHKTLKQIIAAVSAEAQLPSQRDVDQQSRSDGTIEAGIEAIQGDSDWTACTDCHKFRDADDADIGPDLTGYASYEWLYSFIANPMHERFYGGDANDRMPAFAPHKDDPSRNQLTHHQLDMLVRWLRGDDRMLGNEKDASP